MRIEPRTPRRHIAKDAHQFDRLTAALAGTRNRRLLLALLTTLPVAGSLRALVGEEAQAAHPARRVRERQDEQRERDRRQQDHEHEVKTRDNGKKKRVGSGSGGAARACPDAVVSCCTLEKRVIHGDDVWDCRPWSQWPGQLGTVGTCWDWDRFTCLPCGEWRSLNFRRQRCNETFPVCAAAPKGCDSPWKTG